MAEHDNDATAALATLPQVAAAAGVRDYRPCSYDDAQRELDRGRRAGAWLACRGAPNYPPHLAEIADAPPLLWVRGSAAWFDRPAVAMVGARNASSLGVRMATRLARDLGAGGCTIVSGLARGIDAAAHHASLDTGTIAVVAGGVDVVYPRENADLTAKIAENGAILSEMPPGLTPQARHFPRRNRLISGMAKGVVVVEAAPKSGSLITARDAADQGREVMAVPGHPVDGRAAGCNMLIRDGATLVRSAQDVAAACALDMPQTDPARTAPIASGPPPTPIKTSPPGNRRQSPVHPDIDSHILALLGPSPIAEDQLLRDLGQPFGVVSAALLSLELDGKVVRQPGGLLARVA